MTAKRMSPSLPGSLNEDGDDSLKKERADHNQKYLTVAQRLERMFGLGDNHALRRKLYVRIQKCTIEHGPDCYQLIQDCVSAAQVADQPDRYFCTAVASELKAQGYWATPTDF